MNFSSLKPDTENNANCDAVSNKRGNFDAVTPFSKEDKILMKNLYECSTVYNKVSG